MRKIARVLRVLLLPALLLVLFSFQGQVHSAPIPIDNSDGMQFNQTFYSNTFEPYNLIYDFDKPFYLTDGTYLGEMIHLASAATRRDGRTFAHPSTYYRWGAAFGGNPSYVRDNVQESILRRDSDRRNFTRAHSLALGYASGALVTPVYANGRLDRVIVEPSPFPSGSYANAPVGIVGEDFELNLSAQEYNPYTEYLRYEVWANNFYKVHEGEVNRNSVSNLRIPLNFTSGGNRPITIRLFDSVNRQTNIQGSIYLNHRPVADFNMNPAPTDRLRTVAIRTAATDADGESLVHRYEYRLKGQTAWTYLSASPNPGFNFPNVGTYEVRQTVTDPYNASDSIIKEIVVENIDPTAAFTGTPNPTNRLTAVQFTSQATDPENDVLTHRYEYREKGQTAWSSLSNSRNPSFVFPKVGTYEVRQTVTDTYNASNSTIREIVVANLGPVADFSWNPAVTYMNTTVSLINASYDRDNDELTYQWAYQEPGSTTWTNFSTLKDPSRVFNRKGIWNIRLSVSDGALSNSIVKAISIENRPPVADFIWNPSTIYNNSNVIFENLASDPDNDTLTYQWAYQAPGTTNWINFSTERNPNRTFQTKGNWNIRLTVSDGAASHAVSKLLTVSNRTPAADFTWNPQTIFNNTQVNFTNQSTDPDGDALTYQWAYQAPGTSNWINFSTTRNPAREFNTKGSWNIRLTVSDGTASNSIVKPLTVGNRAPVADFTWNPSTIYLDTQVNFTNGSTDPDRDSLTYQWAYQAPGTTNWVNFSADTNPVRTFQTKGSWSIRLTASDGTANHAVTKSLIVGNRAPQAAFNWNPSTIYNDTLVSFRDGSSDPDGDRLTYQWTYQAPGTSNWVNFSTAENPAHTFQIKGTWGIRLTVSDGAASNSLTRSLTVGNRPPIAAFGWNPTEIHTNTAVTFSNASTDPDQDELTYQWAFQRPGTTIWTNFSAERTPTQTFNVKGTWNIRLTVSDGTVSTALNRTLTVLNTPPEVTLEYSPETIYEGDRVTLTAIPTDLDGDRMTVIFEERINGTWHEFNRATNVNSGETITYQFRADPKTYQLRVRAIDNSNGVGVAEVGFTSQPLEIKGAVNHTPDWQIIHDEAGHESNQFFAGERFLTEAVVTDHPIKKVTVSFAGEQITGNLLTLLLPMVERTHPVYHAEIYDRVAGDPAEHLAPGMVYFVFEAEWENGVVKQDRVGVNIVSDIYGAFDFYRSN